YNAFGFKNAPPVFRFKAVFKALATAESKWKLGSGEISGPRFAENPGEPRLCARRVFRRESFLNSHSASDRPQERLQAATAICSALELISVLLQGDAHQFTSSTHGSHLEKLLQGFLNRAIRDDDLCRD